MAGSYDGNQHLRMYGWRPPLGRFPGVRGHGTTQDHDIGTRRRLPDGRSFVYGYAGTGGLQSEFGCCINQKTITNAVAPAQASGAGTAGSEYVTMTVAATDGNRGTGVVTSNELYGGSIVIGNGTSQHPQMRNILANTAVAAGGGACTVQLDEPLGTAVTVATTNIETMLNPYANLTSGNVTNSDYVWFAGVPAVTVSAAEYLWIQTWGPCWITSNGNTCNSAGDRSIYFVSNGSVVSGDDESSTDNTRQLAGFAMDTSSSGSSNAPFVYLQISY